MDDKTLLQMAARAAGIPLKPDFAERYEYYIADRLMWNPLTNDGDALRLAVKLGLMVDASCQPALILCAGPCGIGLEESARADPYAATRRAIVRAAAELGRNIAAPANGEVKS